MQRDSFRLKKFKLTNKQDVQVAYKHSGRDVKSEEFTAAIHPDLYSVFIWFEKVFFKLTGFEPSEESNIDSFDLRGINIFSSGDELKSVIVTGVIALKNGYSTNVNTPKVPVEEISNIMQNREIEDQLLRLENEVFDLLENGKLGHVQGELFGKVEEMQD